MIFSLTLSNLNFVLKQLSFAGLPSSTLALITGVSVAVILVLVSGLLAFFCVRQRRRRRKENKSNQAMDEDLNPVYGLYYFSDGERVDDNNSEMMDENTYYG